MTGIAPETLQLLAYLTRAHIRDTEEFISEFRKDREGDR